MSGIVSYLQSRQSDRLERGNCGETLAELLPFACPVLSDRNRAGEDFPHYPLPTVNPLARFVVCHDGVRTFRSRQMDGCSPTETRTGYCNP
jgi:hypothetical protein